MENKMRVRRSFSAGGKKLYLTALMVSLTSSWSMLQATDYSVYILNTTPDTVYVQLNFKKKKRNSTQGRQVTVPAHQAVNGTYVDTLTNAYAAKQPIPVNKDGCAGANERKRVTGIIEVSLPSLAGKPENYINSIAIEQDGAGMHGHGGSGSLQANKISQYQES